MTAVILIAFGGAVGAMVRWAASSRDRDLPWGMIVVNVVASGLAGWAAGLDGSLGWLVSVGLLGALSTWSSLAVSVAQLVRADRIPAAVAVLSATVVASIAAAAITM